MNKLRNVYTIEREVKIARLDWTQSKTQQNMEQLQNPTMGVTTNQQQQNHRLRTDSGLSYWEGWGFKCILLVPNLRPRFCCC